MELISSLPEAENKGRASRSVFGASRTEPAFLHAMHMYDYWVYILRCSDGSYYTGVTNNAQGRLWQHQQGIHPTSYTYSRRPVEMVYTAHFDDVHEAIAWEKHIKRWSRRKKEALIRGDQAALELFSKRKSVYMKALAETEASEPHVALRDDQPLSPS